MSLLFGLPVFVFASPYAAVAGLTIAHGLQYLLLMGMLAAGGPRPGPAAGCGWRRCATSPCIGGALLSLASDGLRFGAAARFIFGLFLGAVMAHFVVDAGLWRMRAEFPRAFLTARLPFLVPAARP